MGKSANQVFVQGRKSGVSTNQNREVRMGTPKTTSADRDSSNSGSHNSELSTAAKGIYKRACADAPDPKKIGDQAMYTR